MKTHHFLASFRAPVGRIGTGTITTNSLAKVHGSFGAFLATQQHNLNARKAFLADMTGHMDAEPESLSVELQGHFIPIY